MRLFLYFLILTPIYSLKATPYGFGIHHEFKDEEPNTLGLVGKTQKYVDLLTEEVKSYLRFMRTANQRIGSNSLLYENPMSKKSYQFVHDMGPVRFTPIPLKRKTEIIELEKDFIEEHKGRYMYCGYNDNMVVPRPRFIKETIEIYRIEPIENEYFSDSDGKVIAITGVKHNRCSGPEVYVPDIDMPKEHSREILQRISKKHKFTNMDTDTMMRHFANGV
jgi:hypothetical protein